MKLEASNDSLYLIPFLLALAGVFFAVLIIRRFDTDKRVKLLTITLTLFAILYFPIFQYWVIWIPEISFWPNNFSLNPSVLNGPIEDHSIYEFIYGFLDKSATILIVCCVIQFISLVSTMYTGLNKVQKVMIWIPFLSVIQLFLILKREFNTKFMMSVLILWTVTTLLAAYYKFLALNLAFLGIDSFSFLDYIMFGETAIDHVDPNSISMTPIGYSYFYIFDLINIVVPFFTWITSILTFIIVSKMGKQKYNLQIN